MISPICLAVLSIFLTLVVAKDQVSHAAALPLSLRPKEVDADVSSFSFATNNTPNAVSLLLKYLQSPSEADASSAAINTKRELAGHSLENRWEMNEPLFGNDGLKILLNYTVNDFITDSMFVTAGR
jgi:hypothetical protein